MGNAKAPGKNNLGLPKVGPGDSLRPSLINKITDKISELTPVQGVGANQQVTTSGSFQTVTKRPTPGHPWKMSFNGTQLHIEVGQFFYNRPGAGGTNLVTTMNDKLGGSRNAWLFQCYEPGGPTWNDANAADLFYMGGAEIFFEDPDCNAISNKQLYVSTDGLRTKRKKGLFYIELGVWNGRQMAPPYPQPGASKQMNGANAAAAAFNQYSLQMKGKTVPIFKWAPPVKETYKGVEYQGMYDIKRFVYPVATVTNNWQLYQGICSDIYHVATPKKPFEVDIAKVDGAWKASIYPGLVNQIVPKIGSDYIDQLPTPLLTINGAGRILIKATYETRKFFPRNTEIIFNGGQNVPEDTETYGYYQIASISMVNGVPMVTQLSVGNKLVNRFKMGATGAYWSWSA
jgi:hypothetical protein